MSLFVSGELIKIHDDKIILIVNADDNFTLDYLTKLKYPINNNTFYVKIKKKICFINERLAPLDELLNRQVKVYIDVKKYQIKNKDWISGYAIIANKIVN